MNLFGLLLGIATLFIIGFGFFWVIRVEYSLGYYWWPYTMGLGFLVIITSIFDILMNHFQKENTSEAIKKLGSIYPELSASFYDWLLTYAGTDMQQRMLYKFENKVIYDISNRDDYVKAIIHYISSTTDHFAINLFNEITKF